MEKQLSKKTTAFCDKNNIIYQIVKDLDAFWRNNSRDGM